VNPVSFSSNKLLLSKCFVTVSSQGSTN